MSVQPRICSICHGPMWQKHGETCPGPRQMIADPASVPANCGCPPGAWHEPTCELVTDTYGGEAA